MARYRKTLASLSSDERDAMKRFSEQGRAKVLEKLSDGFTLDECAYDEFIVRKELEYYGISRSGNVYPR